LLETALDETTWDAFSGGSALRRAGRAGFARNICIGLGNWASPDAVPVLARALCDAEPLVRAHAAWALGRVGSAEARSALSLRVSVETDAFVRDELLAAMDA
jgi:epoxyqueuosine reductase